MIIGVRVDIRGVLLALLMGVVGGACTSARSGLLLDGGKGGASGKDASTVTPDASRDRASDAPADASPEVALPECPPGQHTCPGGCVSDSDPQTCGASCTPCDAPTNGVATCDGKSCGGMCSNGQQLCHGACIDANAPCAGGCPTGEHVVRKPLSVGDGRQGLRHVVHGLPGPDGRDPVDLRRRQMRLRVHHRISQVRRRLRAGHRRDGLRNVVRRLSHRPQRDRAVPGRQLRACRARPTTTCAAASASATPTSGSCGTSSCTACIQPTGGSVTCDGTQCVPACPASMKLCAGTCIPSTTACSGVCPSGTHDCSGICASNTDVGSCGTTSCTACPLPTGATSTSCNGSTCGFTCGAGTHVCGTGAGTRCAADNDPPGAGPPA